MRRALTALSVCVACGGEGIADRSHAEVRLSVVRTAERCAAGLRGDGPALDAHFDAGLFALVEQGEQRLEIDLIGDDASAPAGTARAGRELLTLERRDGWAASYEGERFALTMPSERHALAERLRLGELGAMLGRLLPLHDFVRAKLPETRALFRVAALVLDAEMAAWPSYRPVEAEPLHMRAGDEPGIGMTCNADVRCPLSAPFCVSETHASAIGMCTRACIDAQDCARDGFDGRCALSVSDVPGISAAVAMCSFACLNDGDCPGLLSCSAAGHCVAGP